MPTLAKIVPFLWYAKKPRKQSRANGLQRCASGRSAIKKESAKVTLNPSLQRARLQHLAT